MLYFMKSSFLLMCVITTSLLKSGSCQSSSTKIPSSIQPPISGPFAPSSFCLAQSVVPAADGTQRTSGGTSCSSTPQGIIPSKNAMVSSLILSPSSGASVDLTQAVDIIVHTRNLQTGFFDDPNKKYYLTPQTLDPLSGFVEGHQHITVQKMSSPTDPLIPTQFDFFKGLNDEAQNGGQLKVTMPPNTLKSPGTYRICSITGTHGHQPVMMPPVPRGPQDDCIRVKVVAGIGGSAVTSAVNATTLRNIGSTASKAVNANVKNDKKLSFASEALQRTQAAGKTGGRRGNNNRIGSKKGKPQQRQQRRGGSKRRN